MTAADLNAELRNLIDERLDAIDHVLTRAQMTWSERRSIVGEVETQIFELLARRSEFPTEADVQAVLETLDPPEAYLPEEFRGEFAEASFATSPPRPTVAEWPGRAARTVIKCLPVAFGVVTLVVINGVILFVIDASNGVLPLIVTFGGLAWLNFEGIRRYRSWSATRQGSLVDDLCHSVGAWLMSQGGAQAT